MFITFDTTEATQKDWRALSAFVTVQLDNTFTVGVRLSDEAVEEQVRKHAETLVDELNEAQENAPKSYDDLTYDELKKLAKLRGIDTGSRRSAGIREMLREVDAKDDAAEDPTEVEEAEEEVLEEDELKRKADEVIARRKAEKAAEVEVLEEEPTEVEEAEGEVLEEDEKDGEDGPTLADATAIATELVSKGKSNVVKAALNDMGVKRVSQLDPSDIAEFIQIVKG